MEGLEKYMDDTNLESLGVNNSTEENGGEDQLESPESNGADIAEGQGDSKPTLEEQLAEFGKEADGEAKEGDNHGLLEQLNALGILRKGMPVEFDDAEKVKEYLSKGFDYTYEKQQFAEERREKEEALTQREQEIQAKYEEAENFQKEHQEQLLQNQVMEQILSELKQNDPDIFNEIAQSYHQRMNMFNMQQNNPMFKGVNEKLTALEKQLQQTTQQKQSEEAQNTVKEWEEGISQVQSEFTKSYRALGVKPNWDKVKQAWQSDSSNSTTVKQAFLAVHGEDLLKAMESQKKLAATKAKSAQRMGPQGSGSESSAPRAGSGHGGGSYMPDLEKIAQKYL